MCINLKYTQIITLYINDNNFPHGYKKGITKIDTRE